MADTTSELMTPEDIAEMRERARKYRDADYVTAKVSYEIAADAVQLCDALEAAQQTIREKDDWAGLLHERLNAVEAAHKEKRAVLRELVEALQDATRRENTEEWIDFTLDTTQAQWPKELRAALAFKAAEQAVKK